MAGTAAIIFILLFLFSYGLKEMFGQGTLLTDFFSANITSGKDVMNFLFIQHAQETRVYAIGGLVIAGTAIILGNPYMIFSAFVFYLLTIATLPMTMFTSQGIDPTFKILVGGTFALMYILAVISWYRGAGDI